jgi:murein DD-endopeptidase MepM/ murein hydrolase activator NlpD
VKTLNQILALLIFYSSFAPYFVNEVQADTLFHVGSQIVFPVLAPRLSSQFGTRTHPVKKLVRHHGGVDLAAPMRSHVRAITAGKVVFAGEYAGYGKLVTIKHDGMRTSLYGHLSEINVNIGQKVNAGDIIGRVGSTGISTGPHLHFEWREDGKALDPLTIFPSLATPAAG